MKTTIKTSVISGIIIATFALTTSCEKETMKAEHAQYSSLLDVSDDGTTSVIKTNLQSALIETPALTEVELASLVKMKDEEKLARDVYSTLYEKWNSPVFSRISASEDNHLNAVIVLLNYYGVADTVIDAVGKFTNSEVQALYDDLIAKGAASLEEAYRTGALIEEMDIKDLTELLAGTSNENITMVFENLMKGSRNHLRTFNRQLSSLGVIYTPVYISQTDYNQIVSSPIEKGKQYKMQGKGKGKGNGSCNGTGQSKRHGKNA